MPNIGGINALLMAEGYLFSGDFRSGYHATASFLVNWEDAFLFMDAVMFNARAQRIGPWISDLPFKFPTGAPIYANAVSIRPCGPDGRPRGINEGLRPGEYFSHAIATIQFDTPQFTWSGIDDPNGLQQLDPMNPITTCEQSVKVNARLETRKGSTFRYDSDSKPVAGDFAVLVLETNLVLTFPNIPFLPWQYVKPFIGKINSVAILGCALETLLLLGMNTVAKQSSSFGSGIAQQITLEFAVQEYSWNKQYKPDGSLDYVHKAFSSDRIYGTVDFGQIFAQLSSSGS